MRGGYFIIGVFVATFLAFVLTGPAFSQEKNTGIPPVGAHALSEILSKVEKRDSFSYVDEVRWDDDGFYQVTYFTTDKAKVEINYNPTTGEPQ